MRHLEFRGTCPNCQKRSQRQVILLLINLGNKASLFPLSQEHSVRHDDAPNFGKHINLIKEPSSIAFLKTKDSERKE